MFMISTADARMFKQTNKGVFEKHDQPQENEMGFPGYGRGQVR